MFSEAKSVPPVDLDGAIVIKRVVNGWRVVLVDTGEDLVVQEYVYEDNGRTATCEAEALMRLLYGNFHPYMQSKYKGGLVIEHREQGREVDSAPTSE